MISAAVRLEPLIVKSFGPAVAFKQTFPKAVNAVAVNSGVGGVIPVPLTATVTATLAPPPEFVTLPVFKPADCGENLTQTAVAAKVAEVYAMVVEAPQVLLSFETWKSVEGAVTFILPGKPVRSEPDRS